MCVVSYVVAVLALEACCSLDTAFAVSLTIACACKGAER